MYASSQAEPPIPRALGEFQHLAALLPRCLHGGEWLWPFEMGCWTGMVGNRFVSSFSLAESPWTDYASIWLLTYHYQNALTESLEQAHCHAR